MSRLAGLTPSTITGSQAELYEAIAGGDRAKDGSFPLTEEDGSLVGPFNALLYSPGIGDAIQQLGAAIRFGSELSPRTREIAILTVAVVHRSDFEWWAHERVGRRVGLSDDELASIRAGAARFDDRIDQITFDVCEAVLETGEVGNELYTRAVDVHGESGLFEVVALIGYYEALARIMKVFEVGVPSGEHAVF